MYFLSRIVLFLMLLPSSGLKHYNSIFNHCSNDSTCLIWFTCTPEKRCQCDNKITTKIVCNNEARVSAVLSCNCVTYDSESKSTYVGSCFYNCQNPNFPHKAIMELPKIPKHWLITPYAHLFIELAYYVVTVKRDTIHWYFHTTSVVWSVQMDIRTGGNLFWLDFCPSQCFISLYLVSTSTWHLPTFTVQFGTAKLYQYLPLYE